MDCPANGINLIIGHPGTGKTILAEQYLFHNADRTPGVYLSTVSEPFDKILRYGESLSFFDTDAIGTSVFYDDLGEVVTDDGLPGVVDQIDELLKEQQPSYVVIDSFKALRVVRVGRSRVPPLPPRPRRPAHRSRRVRRSGSANTTGTKPPMRPSSRWPTRSSPWHVNRTAERELRVLQVLKLRGSGFRSGEHAYRIGPDGLDVFPRLADDIETASYTLGTRARLHRNPRARRNAR